MEKLFERLMEFTGDGVSRFTFDDGILLFTNKGYLDILDLDCTPEEVIGKPLREFFIRTEEEGALRNVLAEKGEVHGYLYHFKTLKGEKKWVIHDAFVTEDPSTGAKVVDTIVKDVTGRMLAEEALAREHNLLRTLIDNLPESVYFKDTESRFVVANDAVAHLMGAPTREALIGRTDFDFYPRELAERYYADERSVISTGQPLASREEPCIDAEGNRRWFSTTKEPVRGLQGEVIGVVGVGRDITRHRQVEEALLEALQRFEAVIEKTPLVAIQGFDQLGYIRHWNAASTRLYGYKAEEALGRRIQDILRSPDEAKHFEPILQKIWTTGAATIPEEWRIRTQTGEERWAYSSIFPVFEHGKVAEAFCMDVDITDRKRAEKALRESETKYRTLFEIFPMGLFLENLEGRIVECSGRACEMYGYPREELLTLTVADLLPERIAARLSAADAEESIGMGAVVESRGRRKTGEIFPTEVSTQIVSIGGERMVFRRVHDITDLKRAEEGRKRLEAQMQQSQKLESLGVLAGGIAHDFNNLLTGIMGYASLALMELPPASPALNNIRQIETTAHRAAELTKQMLAYSGRGRFIVQPVQISEVIEEMGHLLEISISKKCVLKYDFAVGLPPIEADVTQLRQVIMNLIINASEAIGDKSGVIAVSTGMKRCDQAYLCDMYVNDNLSEGLYVYLDVADTGCGMTPEVRAKLFDPFFTTKFTGRGLGLAALLGIMRGHRGAVKVYSEAGRGSTFKVLFPAAKGVTPAAIEGAPPQEVHRGTGMILVVDDEEVVRELAKEILENAGFTVLAACDGREAMDVYQAHSEEIRAVVLDLTMPHMDGVETFTEMRRIHGDVRVILSSGYNEQDAMERFAGKGLAGFIHKPYCADDLAGLVCKVACMETGVVNADEKPHAAKSGRKKHGEHK